MTPSAPLPKARPPAAKPAAKKPPAAPARPPKAAKPAPPPAAPPGPGIWARLGGLYQGFARFLNDALGILLLAVAALTLLAFVAPHQADGRLLNWWAGLLRVWLGWGATWVALLAAVGGGYLLGRPALRRLPKLRWSRVFALEAAFFLSITLLAFVGGADFLRADRGLDGGRLGWALAEVLSLLTVGLVPRGVWIGLLGLILLPLMIYGLALDWIAVSLVNLVAPPPAEAEAFAPAPILSVAPAERPAAAAPARRKALTVPPEYRQNLPPPPEPEPVAPSTPTARDGRLPPFDLLAAEQIVRPDERQINTLAGVIIKTLDEFGIPAHVASYQIGPTVTQFAVVPGYTQRATSDGEIARNKVRVAQILALQRDLTLALAASRLRIEAPVPGRPYVGIEVPNARASLVRLRPLLESEAFFKLAAPLGIALGRDVSGAPVLADLARMPHLLVAGTTGSGKSVCIAALTVCLAFNNSPDDLKLLMVDPKMVELVRFNGLPHLLGPVETELERILGVLRWTVTEMERRYKLLESAHVRNLDTYNRKQKRTGGPTLPRLVLLIDELADLMMSAPDQTEHNLVRLAQMARAVGIHLVVATQRPSTDVVTGLIKANFPARIAFAVASSVDSRVILDTTGAEALLSRGDMLFLPPEVAAPVRCQGAMVSDAEIDHLLAYWQQAAPPTPGALSPWDALLAEEAVLADRDGLVQQAVKLVQETQKASTSLLQRRLKIGYPRAAHLMDELEELGVIGPSTGGGREREVLLARGDESPFLPAAGEGVAAEDEDD